LDTVGSAPLIRLKKMSSGNVFVKAEHLNPGGSIKDRVAKNIIESAEREETQIRDGHYRSNFWKYRNWIKLGGKAERL